MNVPANFALQGPGCRLYMNAVSCSVQTAVALCALSRNCPKEARLRAAQGHGASQQSEL